MLAIFGIGFIFPENRVIPVQGASSNDWNKDSFWYEPWGTSGAHKGIDIFDKKDTPLLATTNLLILYKAIKKGGNIIIGLGPKWRVHYYAHLEKVNSDVSFLVKAGNVIGTVGDSGNAQGKQPHLHYSIVTLLPYVWRIDSSTQGYKKALFLNPVTYLKNASQV